METQVPMFGAGDIQVDDSDSWCTPAWICNLVMDYFGRQPDLDPCTNLHAVMHAGTKWTIADDCLSQPTWQVRHPGSTFIWMNPPYSNPGPFMARMSMEVGASAIGLALVKHDHSTQWWADAMPSVSAVAMLKKRVKHVLAGAEGEGCSFPSSILLMTREHLTEEIIAFRETFGPHAHVMESV